MMASSYESRGSVDHEQNRKFGFFWQMKIAIIRIILLAKRKPIGLICELLIPIVFVAGAVFLWDLLSHATAEGVDYYSSEGLDESALFYSAVPLGMCYENEPVGSLRSCSFLKPFTDPRNVTRRLMCSKAATGAPAGVCGLGITGIVTRIGWRDVVARNSSYIPSIDELVPIQWMNSIFYDNTRYRYITANSLSAAMHSTGTLYFAPSSDDTAYLVQYLNEKYVYFSYIYGGTFDTVGAAEARVKERTGSDPPIWGIIQVSSLNAQNFDVTIRVNNTALPLRNTLLVPSYAGGIPYGGPSMYVFSGFSTLQKAIYDYYLVSVLKKETLESVAALPSPTVDYDRHLFLTEVGSFGPLIIVFGFLYPVSQMTKRLVTDKELRIRESMLIMGLPRTVIFLSWIVLYTVQFLFISIILTVIMKYTFLPNANAIIMFLCLFLFTLSLITLSGLQSSFFSKSRVAAIVAPLIYFALSIPLFAMEQANASAKGIITILSPSALSIGIQLIFSEELNGGFSSRDLHVSTPSMVVVLLMLVVDFFLYGILMVYFDFVLPQDWGSRRHPLFFIIDPIRFCFKLNSDRNPEDGRAENGVFEDQTDSQLNPIQIKGLRKEYGSGKKRIVAVNNFYWSMKEGEISVLLGHNGAGKTTLINMMTGMTDADAGDCIVYGKSVHRSISEVRKDIGFCPQHNILWPDLTCMEHLWFYGSIKGLYGEMLNTKILQILEHVNLLDKMDYRASKLSGGQKRKLSVAIAFVGGSRFVFLDEPTAGMDVNARRSTWDLLRLLSNNHSILLTTHFMDEADLLGDSVAIMNKGRLQCAGSNFFLKSKLGLGYVLTLSIAPSTGAECVSDLVLSQLPEAGHLGSTVGEMMFSLPMSSKNKFSSLLVAIEEAIEGNLLGVTGYSLAATTLEEVFLHVVQDAENEDHGLTAEGDENHVWNISVLESRGSRVWSQFKAQLLKRLWNSLRDRRTQFFQIVCPVVCVLLAMLIMLIPFFDNTSLVLSSHLYGKTVVIDVGGCSDRMDLSQPFASNARTNTAFGFATAADLDTYQKQTYFSHPQGLPRYGGLFCDDPSTKVSFVFYNASAYHEIGIGLFNLYNGVYRKTENTDKNLVTACHCMPQTHTEKKLTNALYSMMISIIIMIPFTFIPSTFVGWIVREKQCRARHLQKISGLSFYVYWFSSFLFDLASYLVAVVLVVLVFLIFHREEYVSSETIGATILVLLLYGLAGIVMAYVLSFIFNDYSTAQNTVLLGNFTTGFLLVLCIAVLSYVPETQRVANVLRWIFRVVPSYCVGEGILNLAQVYLLKSLGGESSVWSMDAVGWPCVYMAIEFPLFFFIVLFIDHPGRRQRTQRLFHNPDAPPERIENEEEDVAQERENVFSAEREDDLVQVQNLRKVYGNGKVAVCNATFGVRPGEVFGFLGTNGAGKTTTISILCQELYPTSGRASICNCDIVEESTKALQCVGYCPQFDATLDLLTTEEHLRLFAGVRGIAYEIRDVVVEGLLSLCQLQAYRNVKSQSLSGGNRRKLSVAISLLGGPRVVLLDEPSAGMDPVARRGLWKAIKSVSSHCAVVLTTHHLEEVEALAHRVAIMVDGTLRCIGSKTHLKSKYGSGFEITARVDSDDQGKKMKTMKFFEEHFEDCIFQEFRARRLTYSVPQNTKLSRVFQVLEEYSPSLPITDYSVSQASIEAVFLRISADAVTEEEPERDKCCRFCCC